MRFRRQQQQTIATPSEDPESEEIKRKIEELQWQLQQLDAHQGQHAEQDVADEEYEEYEEEEYYEEEEIVEEIIEEEEELVEEPPLQPTHTRANAAPTSFTQPPDPQPEHVAYSSQMDSLKKQNAWERPNWAAAAEDSQDRAVIDDPINNPMLKQAQHGGYVRQVQPKDLEIVKGTFVKPQKATPKPRLAWIVVNVNKRKVGKIVMHLYGLDVDDIVDQFLELKGCELERSGNTLVVLGMQPTLYVSSGSPKGLGAKSGVHGVIQEGQDIFQTVMAAEADAALSIKQAHIFPVKKGKGM